MLLCFIIKYKVLVFSFNNLSIAPPTSARIYEGCSISRSNVLWTPTRKRQIELYSITLWGTSRDIGDSRQEITSTPVSTKRIRTALACVCNPSQSASVATTGPSALSSALSSCEVKCFWKDSEFTSPYWCAYPFVGKAWFVPDA